MEEALVLYERYKDWIFLALSVLLAIPSGIISNRLDTYLKNRLLSARERKRRSLIIRYITLKSEREHPAVYFRREGRAPIRHFWLPLISIGLFLIVLKLFPNYTWFRMILSFMISLPMYYGLVLIIKDMSIDLENLEALFFFDRFKRRTIKKLERLGCNPKDYGIE